LLGLDPLTTPYKIIAADIDRSNSVTSLDVIELRKLVLGIYTELPNNTSWRMVDAGFTFLDPSAPFSTDIPESYQIPNLTGDMDIDFIGIKVGDVNNTAVANVNDDPNADRSGETSYLVAEEAFLEPGIYEINFSARDLANIAGFQFTLNANPLRAQLLNFKPNAPIMTDKHYSDQYMDRGIVSCSWDTKQQLETGDILFTATINVIEASWVSEIFELSSDVTFKEAYANGDINDIAIAYERSNIDEGMVLYQNNPNPWSDQTEITFFISDDSDITFNVFDVNGRLIHYKNIEAEEGLNTIMLDRNDISGYGVMYYELVNEDQRLIKKMILIK